jgi:hypothetical protein
MNLIYRLPKTFEDINVVIYEEGLTPVRWAWVQRFV